MALALLEWFNNVSSTGHHESYQHLCDGSSILVFAKQYLGNEENTTPITTTTNTSNNFFHLRQLLVFFLKCNDFEDAHTNSIEALVQQVQNLERIVSAVDRVFLSLEVLLCCCVTHPSWRFRETSVEKIMSLPLEHQQILMEIIEKRLSAANDVVVQPTAAESPSRKQLPLQMWNRNVKKNTPNNTCTPPPSSSKTLHFSSSKRRHRSRQQQQQ